jgi:hypothetical protein
MGNREMVRHSVGALTAEERREVLDRCGVVIIRGAKALGVSEMTYIALTDPHGRVAVPVLERVRAKLAEWRAAS